MRDPPPLCVDLVPSRLRRAFIVTTFGAAAALLLILPVSPPLRGFSLTLVAALGLQAWREEPPATLVVRLDGTLAMILRDGAACEATLVGGYLGVRLVTIVFRRTGRRRCQALAIVPDMLGADDLRRLRVRLAYSRSDDDAGLPASHARASTSAPLSALRWRPTRST